MHALILKIAFSWLAVSGLLHFLIDVLGHHLMGRRTPSLETTLYYGLHSTFAWGQIMLGVALLWLSLRFPETVSATVAIVFCVVAASGWLLIGFLFMEYWQPKAMLGVFLVLIMGAFIAKAAGS